MDEPQAVSQSISPAGLRSALFALLLLFLNLQLDGFHLAHTATRQQRLLLPFTLFFCVCVAALLIAPALQPKSPNSRLLQPLRGFATGRTPHILLLPFFGLSLLLLLISARFYAAFGYRLHPWPTAIVFLGSLGALAATVWRSRTSSAATLFTAILASYSAVSLLSIASFPLNLQRSDMLPLLLAAGHSLLSGANPYHLYTFPTETVFLTYLPGTLLAYLPAALLHVDPRLLNLAYVLALAVLLFRAASPRYRFPFTALLGLWLLSPYLLYRHELYTEPHWLAVIASLLLLARRRLTWSALVFGLSISLSQFSWVLFPFFLLFLLERHGTRAALHACLLALGIAAAVTLPFLLWSPTAFRFGILSHWQNTLVSARPVNLSFWTAALVGLHHLQLVQALLLTALFVTCAVTRSCATLAHCLRAMAIALTVFILWNVLVWGYFFLLLELLMLLYIAAANGWLAESTS